MRPSRSMSPTATGPQGCGHSGSAPAAARAFKPGQFYRLQNYEVLAPRVGGGSASAVAERAVLEAEGVPSGPVNDIGELAASPQFAAMDMMQALPEGGPRVVGLPISFNRRRPVSRRPAPRIGQHNQEILGRP